MWVCKLMVKLEVSLLNYLMTKITNLIDAKSLSFA